MTAVAGAGGAFNIPLVFQNPERPANGRTDGSCGGGWQGNYSRRARFCCLPRPPVQPGGSHREDRCSQRSAAGTGRSTMGWSKAPARRGPPAGGINGPAGNSSWAPRVVRFQAIFWLAIHFPGQFQITRSLLHAMPIEAFLSKSPSYSFRGPEP